MADKNTIEDRLINEVALILSQDPSGIKPDIPLHELGLDSLSFVEILVFIEKAFGFKLMESGLKREDFRTVRSLSSYISRLQNR